MSAEEFRRMKRRDDVLLTVWIAMGVILTVAGVALLANVITGLVGG